jgi:hypothetical protein
MAGESLPGPITLHAFATGAAQVKAEGLAYPEKAMALGPVRVIPREMPGVTCGLVDLDLPGAPGKPALVDRQCSKSCCRPPRLPPCGASGAMNWG